MIYSIGGTVTASDYNDLIAQINAIFGVGDGDSGYGGNSVKVPSFGDLVDASEGDDITNEMWLDLRNAFDDCALHQDTTLTDGLPSVNDIEEGDLVSFFPRLNSSQNIFDLTVNRLQVDSTFVPEMEANPPNNVNSVRTTPWSSFIQHVFTITFSDSDHARYFFNTGGYITIAASRTGGTGSPQEQAWDSILSGPDFMFTGEHYFSLTGSAEELRPQISPSSGPYSGVGAYSASNIWTILGERVDSQGPNGGNGSVIKIYSNFLDGNTNPPDTVEGTFSSLITEFKFIDIFDQIDSPIYSTITELSGGL